jgi:hypothetical protein
MRGYPIIFGEGVDPDAYQYFLRAGIASGTQTPTSYDNAARFNGTSQFLRISDNASLRLAGTDFTISLWVRPTVLSGGFLVSKWAGGNDYAIYQFATGRFTWTTRGVDNVSAGSLSVGTWSLIVITYTGTTLRIYLNGTLDSTFTSVAPPIDTTNNYSINADSGGSASTNTSISSVGLWKRALTASEVTALFNNGAGRTYASLDSGLRTNLVSWWALNQNSVTADSHGTNTLTNNGTPLVTATTLGPIVTTTQNSRQLINNFVKGIKSLGLWNSMVCWPLRSSQNAGGGTTAFSLGGLGRFDGTLVNAPTWGSDGINCATTSQRLSFGPAVNIQSYGGFTIFGTQIHRNLSSSFDLSLWTRDDSFWPESTFQSVSQSVARIRISTSPSRHVTAERVGTEQNSFHSYHATVDSNESGFLTYNKTSPVAFGAPSTTGLPPTIDWTLARTASGVYAMHGVMRRYTQGQQAQLYDLYRQTLGLGLGLP